MDAAEYCTPDATTESTTPCVGAPDHSGLRDARIAVDEQGRVGEVLFEANAAVLLRGLRIPAEWSVMANTVRPATGAEVAAEIQADCVFCLQQPTDHPIEVGRTRSYSGPGWPIEVCLECVRFRRLMPYSEHPIGSLGGLRLADSVLLEEAL